MGGVFPEITNKGSSWLGPVVISQVYKQTGELRYAFIYILVMTLVPALLLSTLDIEVGRKEAQEYVTFGIFLSFFGTHRFGLVPSNWLF